MRDATFAVTTESTDQIRQQIAAGAERRSINEAEEIKKLQEQYRLKQEQIKDILPGPLHRLLV